MDAPVILIADSNPEFRQELGAALRGRYRVQCCSTGSQALALLLQLRPELLVLDLMLPELDGFRILQLAADAGLHPKVLATTLLSSNFVLNQAQGIDYVMRHPCDIPTVVKRLDALAGPQADSRVAGILHTLNFPSKLNGSTCLPMAVALAAERPSQSMTKELYPEVGRRCDPKASGAKVEKDIRYAIGKAWAGRNEEAWSQYFTPDANGELKKPTNREFILRLVEVLDSRGA